MLPCVVRSGLAIGLSIALMAQESPPPPKYKIEILSAAGNPKKRKKNTISSESVIRVTDQNDVPVAGVTVMFAISQLSGGSASFANGASSTIVTTNAAGVAATGEVEASATSTFNINATASVSGQSVTTTIPISMATVAAAAGGGAAISGVMIGVIIAVAAGAAVGAAVALGGGSSSSTPSTPTTPPVAGIRIGGPGTPVIGAPR